MKTLPTVEEAGAIAVGLSEELPEELTADEQAFFIAGFQEAIKYLYNQSINKPFFLIKDSMDKQTYLTREELKFLRNLLPKEEYFAQGDRIFIEMPSFSPQECIIARTGRIVGNQREIALINLKDGNRWIEPFYVDNVKSIPKSLIKSNFSVSNVTIIKKEMQR